MRLAVVARQVVLLEFILVRESMVASLAHEEGVMLFCFSSATGSAIIQKQWTVRPRQNSKTYINSET